MNEKDVRLTEFCRRSGYDGWLVVGADLLDADGMLRYLTDARSYLQRLLEPDR